MIFLYTRLTVHLVFFAAEHNVLLREAASLEKTLTVAVKSHDEAVATLDESRKREEDLRASIAAREKLFEEQIFSIAKSLSGIFPFVS